MRCNMIQVYKFIVVFLILAATLGARAQATFRSPRTAALGGAGRANPVLNDSIYQNPSFASFLPVYSWSGNFKALGEGRGRAYDLSVLDGRSELFQAGLAYEVRDLYRAFHVAASRKIDEKTTLGLGGRFYLSKDESRFAGYRDFSASATHVPFAWLQVAAVAENLDRSPELVIGTRFRITERFMIYVDPHFRLSTSFKDPLIGHEIGAEFPIFKDLYFRMGGFRAGQISEIGGRANGVGYGVGWVAPRLSLDFSVEHLLVPVDQVSHTTGMTVYF